MTRGMRVGAAFLGPRACRAGRLSCLVKAVSQIEALPPPGWCWESGIKITAAFGIFGGDGTVLRGTGVSTHNFMHLSKPIELCTTKEVNFIVYKSF